MDGKEFGQYLKSIRNKRGYSLTELGNKIGYSNPYLSQIETGKKGVPSPKLLRKLADGLEFPYEQLLYIAEHSNYNPAGHLGTHIKMRREEEGYSIEELSIRSGVDKEVLFGIENGIPIGKMDIEKIAYGLYDDKDKAAITSDLFLKYAKYKHFRSLDEAIDDMQLALTESDFFKDLANEEVKIKANKMLEHYEHVKNLKEETLYEEYVFEIEKLFKDTTNITYENKQLTNEEKAKIFSIIEALLK